MLNKFTVLLNRGNYPKLLMLPRGAEKVWQDDDETVVLLDSKAVVANIEKTHNDISALWAEIDKVGRLSKAIERENADMDMPVYHLTGKGHFDDLTIEQGRHRTYMLLASYGVEFMPVLVPISCAAKIRRLFGYRNGYLTKLVHNKDCALKAIERDGQWVIGTEFERESVETFATRDEAESALAAGNWAERTNH